MSMIIDGTNGLTFNNATTQASAGSVLQVVNSSTSTEASSSSDGFATTGLSASITPRFATSKILVLVSQNGCRRSNANSSNSMDLRILRNGSSLVTFAATFLATSTALEINNSASGQFLDSPATTSSTTYNTDFRSRNNTASVQVQFANVSTSTITLMEIAA